MQQRDKLFINDNWVAPCGDFNGMAPFGGYQQSGNGRELGRFGLYEFLEYQSLQCRPARRA